MPMALTLVEAIAGREKAEAVARDLGVKHWDISHDSAAFKFTRPFALTTLGNTLAFWNREQLGIELSPGIDEVSSLWPLTPGHAPTAHARSRFLARLRR